MNAGSKQFHDYCDQRIAAGEIEIERVAHNYYTLRNAAIQTYGLDVNSVVGADLLAAVFLKVKTQLTFIEPEHQPTAQELRAERERRLEATNNIGPLSARNNPRRIDDPTGGIGTLKEFVDKAIGNLNKASRGDIPQSQEKPKKQRVIPANVTPEQLRDGDWSVAEIKDYLARRPKTLGKK